MSGGVNEYTASYVNNGNGNLTRYGSSLVNAAAEYKDVYTSSGDTQAGNYSANSKKVGDAVYETSSNINGSYSWHGDYSYMPSWDYPFFMRGGYYADTTISGIFYFDDSYNAHANSRSGFRPVLIVDGTL
ncbi:hypothetical protein D3C71_1335090 [compost metagenome]